MQFFHMFPIFHFPKWPVVACGLYGQEASRYFSRKDIHSCGAQARPVPCRKSDRFFMISSPPILAFLICSNCSTSGCGCPFTLPLMRCVVGPPSSRLHSWTCLESTSPPHLFAGYLQHCQHYPISNTCCKHSKRMETNQKTSDSNCFCVRLLYFFGRFYFYFFFFFLCLPKAITCTWRSVESAKRPKNHTNFGPRCIPCIEALSQGLQLQLPHPHIGQVQLLLQNILKITGYYMTHSQ